ncbi:MAG: DUF4252 domain-containing protein [Tannerellaceae bacterium]|jgi:hypothetical protein|nr:DUF4252 domain-containing protein [Tannerellaceae bacterium]
MFKKSVYLGILLMACHAGFGQGDVKQLFSEFAKLKEVNRINIGAIGMKFAGFSAGIENIEILELEDCSGEIKERFTRAVRSLNDKGFDTVVTASENGKNIKVLLRIEDEFVRELLILSSGDSPAMIHIQGRIKQSDIRKVIGEHSR